MRRHNSLGKMSLLNSAKQLQNYNKTRTRKTKKGENLKYKIVKISLVGEVGKSFPDLTKQETPDHVVDYKGHSISLLLVN